MSSLAEISVPGGVVRVAGGTVLPSEFPVSMAEVPGPVGGLTLLLVGVTGLEGVTGFERVTGTTGLVRVVGVIVVLVPEGVLGVVGVVVLGGVTGVVVVVILPGGIAGCPGGPPCGELLPRLFVGPALVLPRSPGGPVPLVVVSPSGCNSLRWGSPVWGWQQQQCQCNEQCARIDCSDGHSDDAHTDASLALNSTAAA